MGALIGKLWGKNSTKDLLEKITAQLKDIESFNRDTQAWQKKVIGTLIAYFSVLYVLAIVFAYYNYYNDPEWQDVQARLKLILPFLVAPFIIFALKRILTWWYHRKLRKNETQLAKLKKERSKILEDVMNTETYKVAKEILDKYGPAEQLKPREPIKKIPSDKNQKQNSKESTQVISRPGQTQDQTGVNTLRQRRNLSGQPNIVSNNHPSSLPGSPYRTAVAPSGNISEASGDRASSINDIRETHGQLQMTPGSLQRGPSQGIQRRIPGPPLPRPVLPRERGYMDRVVEYLVGDGPSNRYALICKQCQSHNGMALKEEFEFIAFRCCYCYYWNPARKQRPVAPKLQQPPIHSVSSTDSSSEDEDQKPIPKTSSKPFSVTKNVLSKKINQEPSDVDKDSNSEGIPPTSKDIEPNKEGPSNEMEDNKPELVKSTDVLEPQQPDKTTTSLDSKDEDEEMDLT